MKLADVLGGKLKGAKFDAGAMHRDTVKRLLRLNDSEVAELTCALHALAEEPPEPPPGEPKLGDKRPPLLAILGKGPSSEKD